LGETEPSFDLGSEKVTSLEIKFELLFFETSLAKQSKIGFWLFFEAQLENEFEPLFEFETSFETSVEMKFFFEDSLELELSSNETSFEISFELSSYETSLEFSFEI
jgi:hypothetical protein